MDVFVFPDKVDMTSLDERNPWHKLFQEFKHHPFFETTDIVMSSLVFVEKVLNNYSVNLTARMFISVKNILLYDGRKGDNYAIRPQLKLILEKKSYETIVSYNQERKRERVR